jgi:hypothetical protein
MESLFPMKAIIRNSYENHDHSSSGLMVTWRSVFLHFIAEYILSAVKCCVVSIVLSLRKLILKLYHHTLHFLLCIFH